MKSLLFVDPKKEYINNYFSQPYNSRFSHMLPTSICVQSSPTVFRFLLRFYYIIWESCSTTFFQSHPLNSVFGAFYIIAFAYIYIYILSSPDMSMSYVSRNCHISCLCLYPQPCFKVNNVHQAKMHQYLTISLALVRSFKLAHLSNAKQLLIWPFADIVGLLACPYQV